MESIFKTMSKITLSPAVIVVDPTRGIAALQFDNPGYDSIPLDLVVRHFPPGSLNTLPSQGSGHNNLMAMPPTWIRNMPRDVTLAPGESRSVPLHVTVPGDAAEGQYILYVTVYYKPIIKVDQWTDLSDNVIPRFFADTTIHGFPAQAYVRAKLVCTVPPGHGPAGGVEPH